MSVRLGQTPEWLRSRAGGWPEQSVTGQPTHPLPQPCFCVGPQNGESECPCRMRAKSNRSEWLEGFEAGVKFAEASGRPTSPSQDTPSPGTGRAA